MLKANIKEAEHDAFVADQKANVASANVESKEAEMHAKFSAHT